MATRQRCTFVRAKVIERKKCSVNIEKCDAFPTYFYANTFALLDFLDFCNWYVCHF
jgi:hypothetical protein